jgi:hypothetical protein
MGKFNRRENTRKEKKIIFIFAEGEKTEPIYFEYKKKKIETEIRRKGIKIEIKGTGRNTLSLVDFAINYINNEKIDLTLDDCWVVFDKDDFNEDFNRAISKAQKNGLKVAYSNEAFELWFLLHFSFMNSAINRSDYNNKLTKNYSKLTGDKKYKYDKTKNVLQLIEIIKSKESDAIRNAKKLIKQYNGEASFLKKNPSTTVHLLVEDLNKLKD